MSLEAFGPNLRRIRIKQGIPIVKIAADMKVLPALLNGLERNDFSNWPEGIYARAYVRQYAYAIGVDPDSTVDEFCRWFPQGDRRAERVVREQATIVGHENLKWKDEPPADAGVDRRGLKQMAKARPESDGLFVRLRRALTRA